MKSSKFILLFIALIALIIVFIWFKNYAKHPSVTNVLKKSAYELNKSAPIMTDNESRLDSVKILEYPVRTFQMYYTLTTQVEKEDIERTFNYFSNRLVEVVSKSPDMKFLRDHNIVVSYVYYDIRGEFLFIYPIGPNLYK